MSDFDDPRAELPPLGDVHEALRRIWSLNHEIERLSARMRRGIGITAQQRIVLRIIGRFPGITPGRLSVLLCLDAATLSTTLARLERRGLITRQRDERDRRRVSVGLSARGRALDIPMTGTVEAAIEVTLAHCDAADLSATYRVLDALTQALIAQEVPTPSTRESTQARGRRRERGKRER